MRRLLLGGAIIAIGLLYMVAVVLILFYAGDPLHPSAGLTFDNALGGILLLPIGLVAIGAGVSVMRARR